VQAHEGKPDTPAGSCAYKGDIDTSGNPPPSGLDELEHKGAAVDYFDPYCPKAKRPGGTKNSIELTPEVLAAYDAVIVTSAHKKGVDYSLVEKYAPLVLDTKNVYGGKERENIVLL
jgi:UDP-N-acetyl-D-mannosaminuronate dehydrogenase